MKVRLVSGLFVAVLLAGASAFAEYPEDCLGPKEPSGEECGDVTFEGCCDAWGRVVYCDIDNKLYCIDCASAGLECGWDPVYSYYDCGESGEDPSGKHPKDCFTCDPPCNPGEVCGPNGCEPCEPNCTDKLCGPDGCGGSCGTCEIGECLEGECVTLGCLPLEGPTCGGCPCEECVCEMDPYCCEEEWDWNCASECVEFCGGCPPVSKPENCGDGTCNPDEGETCSNCPEDCGCAEGETCFQDACCKPNCEGKECGDDGCGGTCGECEVGICDAGKCNVGLGCVPTETPGCPGCPCEECVCETYLYCCEKTWDESCAQECLNNCGGCYQMPACGDGVCTPDEHENCFTCPADCTCLEGVCFKGECCLPQCEGKECGDDGCGGTCGECEVGVCDGGKCNVGLGCVATETPGCPGCPCEECVCEKDPYCCKGSWDEFCAKECLEECGGCYQMPACGDGACTPDEHENCFTCPADCTCLEGVCFNGECCLPQCEGKECGDDSCGGTCGECIDGTCFEYKCYTGEGCVPSETPGCGGCYCEECVCAADEWCCEKEWDELCVEACIADCGGCVNPCGDGVCNPDDGENCETCVADCPCPEGQSCQAGECVCVPMCEGKECGDDGCGGLCGVCTVGVCTPEGKCVCTPMCEGKECGDDGCGGSCGECDPGFECSADFTCQPIISPDVVEQETVEEKEAIGEEKRESQKEEPEKKKEKKGGGCSAGTNGSIPSILLFLSFLALLGFRRAASKI